jgi:hypothetical protein
LVKTFLLGNQHQEPETTQVAVNLEKFLNVKDGRLILTLILISLLKQQFGKKYVMLLVSQSGRKMKITLLQMLDFQD